MNAEQPGHEVDGLVQLAHGQPVAVDAPGQLGQEVQLGGAPLLEVGRCSWPARPAPPPGRRAPARCRRRPRSAGTPPPPPGRGRPAPRAGSPWPVPATGRSRSPSSPGTGGASSGKNGQAPGSIDNGFGYGCTSRVSRSRASASSVRYPRPARTRPAVNVVFPASVWPGSATATPAPATPPAWSRRWGLASTTRRLRSCTRVSTIADRVVRPATRSSSNRTSKGSSGSTPPAGPSSYRCPAGPLEANGPRTSSRRAASPGSSHATENERPRASKEGSPTTAPEASDRSAGPIPSADSSGAVDLDEHVVGTCPIRSPVSGGRTRIHRDGRWSDRHRLSCSATGANDEVAGCRCRLAGVRRTVGGPDVVHVRPHRGDPAVAAGRGVHRDDRPD